MSDTYITDWYDSSSFTLTDSPDTTLYDTTTFDTPDTTPYDPAYIDTWVPEESFQYDTSDTQVTISPEEFYGVTDNNGDMIQPEEGIQYVLQPPEEQQPLSPETAKTLKAIAGEDKEEKSWWESLLGNKDLMQLLLAGGMSALSAFGSTKKPVPIRPPSGGGGASSKSTTALAGDVGTVKRG